MVVLWSPYFHLYIAVVVVAAAVPNNETIAPAAVPAVVHDADEVGIVTSAANFAHAAAAAVKYAVQNPINAGDSLATGRPPVAPKTTVPRAEMVGAVTVTEVDPVTLIVPPESVIEVAPVSVIAGDVKE